MTLTDRERGLFYDVSVGYLHRVLPRALREGLPPIGERWGGFGDSSEVDVRERIIGALDSDAWLAAIGPAESQRRSQFQDFLRSLRPPEAGQRVLYVEHALLPHGPAAFLPSGRQYGSVMTVAGIEDTWKRWRSSPLFVDQALQRHLLQVGYVDRLVGTLVRRLKQAGLYDRALVVVTADHGISFEPGAPAVGYQGESPGHRGSPALRQVSGPAAGARRSQGRPDDRHRPDDRGRDRRTNPVAHRRAVAPRQAGRAARHRSRPGGRVRVGGGGRRRSRRARDRPAERGVVRSGHGFPVSARRPPRAARPLRRRAAAVDGRARRRPAGRRGAVRRRPHDVAVLALSHRRGGARRLALTGDTHCDRRRRAGRGDDEDLWAERAPVRGDGARGCLPRREEHRRRVQTAGGRRSEAIRAPGVVVGGRGPGVRTATTGLHDRRRRNRTAPERDAIAVVSVAVRASGRVVGVRSRPTGLLDVEGEPGVPRGAWLDALGRDRVRPASRRRSAACRGRRRGARRASVANARRGTARRRDLELLVPRLVAAPSTAGAPARRRPAASDGAGGARSDRVRAVARLPLVPVHLPCASA